VTDLHLTDRGPVRVLVLDRPESLNGLTVELVYRLRDAIREAPPEIRTILLGGANGAFCSGLDLKDAMRRGVGPGPQLEQDLREGFHGLIRALVEGDRPTIACVDGAAAGFGCDLALACDVRFVSERAKFGESFVKRGLMPDGGGTWTLPRLVGVGRALELLYTGDTVSAEEAVRIGLANKLYPASEVFARAEALALRIANGPPLVHRFVKRAVYAGLDGDLGAALDREAAGQLQLLRSSDFTEGVTAFLQKREPRFQGK
jgi:enoyl-CoA hydratase/carnithine racemase